VQTPAVQTPAVRQWQLMQGESARVAGTAPTAVSDGAGRESLSQRAHSPGCLQPRSWAGSAEGVGKDHAHSSVHLWKEQILAGSV